MKMTERPLSLAALTVLELSPAEMIAVAAEAGYQAVGLRLIPATEDEHHFDLLSSGALRKQVKRELHQSGLRVLDIEILRLKSTTEVVDDFSAVLALGAEFGATEVLVAGNDADQHRLQDNWMALCALCKEYGLFPHLECMPWTDVPNLNSAHRIVSKARVMGADNACLLIDPFHIQRSHSDFRRLSDIEPEWMRYAQLCDVIGPVPASMDRILFEARQSRCFPGQGDIDLLSMLRNMPVEIPLSLEVPTESLRLKGVSALQRAVMARESALQVLQRAQSEKLN